MYFPASPVAANSSHQSSMILVWLLEANYTLNILVFLHWWQIIQGTFPFFFTGSQVADTTVTTYHKFTKYSK